METAFTFWFTRSNGVTPVCTYCFEVPFTDIGNLASTIRDATSGWSLTRTTPSTYCCWEAVLEVLVCAFTYTLPTDISRAHASKSNLLCMLIGLMINIKTKKTFQISVYSLSYMYIVLSLVCSLWLLLYIIRWRLRRPRGLSWLSCRAAISVRPYRVQN